MTDDLKGVKGLACVLLLQCSWCSCRVLEQHRYALRHSTSFGLARCMPARGPLGAATKDTDTLRISLELANDTDALKGVKGLA
jgi:hypothetical protein